MRLINQVKCSSILRRKSNEELYAVVACQMEQGIKNHPLWLKSIEDAKGNKELRNKLTKFKGVITKRQFVDNDYGAVAYRVEYIKLYETVSDKLGKVLRESYSKVTKKDSNTWLLFLRRYFSQAFLRSISEMFSEN